MVLVSHVGPIKALLAAVLEIPLQIQRRLFLDPGDQCRGMGIATAAAAFQFACTLSDGPIRALDHLPSFRGIPRELTC